MATYIENAGLDYGCPIDWTHPLNRGLVDRWRVLPGQFGSDRLYGLRRNIYGTLKNALPWSGNNHPGGQGSLDYNGTNHYVDLGNDKQFDALQITLSAWFRADTVATTHQMIFTKDDGNGCWALGINTNKVYSVTFVSNVAKEAIGTTTFTANVWRHVALTCNGVTNTIYLDGKSDGSVAAGSPDVLSQTIMIGRRSQGGSALHFDGSIDDVCYYSRALSAVEIAQLYQAQQQQFDPTLNWVEDYYRRWPHGYGQVVNNKIGKIGRVPINSILKVAQVP